MCQGLLEPCRYAQSAELFLPHLAEFLCNVSGIPGSNRLCLAETLSLPVMLPWFQQDPIRIGRYIMKIVVLDGYTENPGDLSWDELGKLGELTVYDRTSLTD